MQLLFASGRRSQHAANLRGASQRRLFVGASRATNGERASRKGKQPVASSLVVVVVFFRAATRREKPICSHGLGRQQCERTNERDPISIASHPAAARLRKFASRRAADENQKGNPSSSHERADMLAALFSSLSAARQLSRQCKLPFSLFATGIGSESQPPKI